MKKLSIAFFLVAFVLLGCSNNTEIPKTEVNTNNVVQNDSKLNAEYLIAHYWLGSNINTGLRFSAPNAVESEIQAETDCHPSGTFQIVSNKVEIELTKCVTEKELLTLTLGEDGENMQFTEFLIDQNGKKYYNTSSTYPVGTVKEFKMDGSSYTIEMIGSDPEVSNSVLLYQKPSLNSPYYILIDDDGSNATKSVVTFDSREFVGKYVSNGETWYLITPFNAVMGDLQLKSKEGDAVLEKNLNSLPYTWINGKDVLNN